MRTPTQASPNPRKRAKPMAALVLATTLLAARPRVRRA